MSGKSLADEQVSTDDVSLSVPRNVAGLITQVDRNAPPVLPKSAPTRSSNLEMGAEHRAITQKPVRRSFLQRFACCWSPSDVLSQATTTSTTDVRPASHGQPLHMPVMDKPVGTFKKLLALDLDETLVHSSFQPVDKASFSIAVTIDAIVHTVYVIKRPGCDEFLQRLAQHYELIIYTASLSKYADPLLDILDPHKTISKRLFRENCVYYDGHYVKDLSLLNREITQTIIVDNSPMSYIFHPENAIDCSSFFDDLADVELWQIADFLVSIKNCPDARLMCRHWREWCKNNPSSVPAPQIGLKLY
ncbi:HAD-like domain-containing protein [Ochromonadaceae sp. CCMP2298]|nr:HAD-like domain-containing protein [Ochromonadaceae sp. CCMP2298]|mmetsp:Transcript_21991/g.47621  ORF Transcript_21991/g.47621 Transcript_21991/m.47621 type:complete len:304 (+) Transcript_21991:219-1130(+)